MTDIELTKACAEAMEIRFVVWQGVCWMGRLGDREAIYDPLHDDAQAMALVKRFLLVIEPDGNCPECQYWAVTWINKSRAKGMRSITARKVPDPLNRAIVECCAKIQAAKQ